MRTKMRTKKMKRRIKPKTMSKRLVALAHFYYSLKLHRNMNAQKVWDAFLQENDNASFVTMANAVIEQLGGVGDYNVEQLNYIRDGSDGYSGFIYYSETCKFWNDNKEAIIQNMHELADDLGEDLITMIKGFGNFKNDESVTYDTIGNALYGSYNEEENLYIYDTFAKYALEEVANRFQDWWYGQPIEDYE